jgi:cytochrome c oxidase subunit 3
MSDARILREPWPDVERQRYGASFGIWTFLVTEMLFFGGLFTLVGGAPAARPLAAA